MPSAPIEIQALPDLVPGEVQGQWRDRFSRRQKHPGFSPSPRQLALMKAVESVAQSGLALPEREALVASMFGFVEPPYPEFAMDVYSARQAVEAKASFEQARVLAKGLRLRSQDRVGTLVLNDGRRLTSARITSVDPRGWVYSISGNRGPCAYQSTLDVFSLKNAMERAHQGSKRTDSFEDFVSKRTHLPGIEVVADPLEPFYKSPEQKAHDEKAAFELCVQAKVQRDRANDCMVTVPGFNATERSHVGRMFQASALLLEARASLMHHDCVGGEDYLKYVSGVERARLDQVSALNFIETTYPQWSINLACADSAIAAELEQQARQLEQAAQLRADLAAQDSTRVREIAASIVRSIGSHAIAKTEKYHHEQLSKRYMTPEKAAHDLDLVRQRWASTTPDDRVLDLARAISKGDPRPLVHAWAKSGQGVAGSEGSMKAFAELTGINLLKLNSVDRAAAIYQWANWSEAQIDAERQLLAQISAQSDARYELAERAKHRAYTSQKAQSHRVNTSDGEISILAYVDGLVLQGFDQIVQRKVGAVTKTYLANQSTGRGYLMTGAAMIEYAKVASEIAKETAATAALQTPSEDSPALIESAPQAM